LNHVYTTFYIIRYTTIDLTQEAVLICKGVQQLSSRDDVTLVHLCEILKGSMNAKIVEKGHNQLEMHSKLCKYKKNDIERFVRKLIFSEYLKVNNIC
jgi:bloom syndrome protein